MTTAPEVIACIKCGTTDLAAPEDSYHDLPVCKGCMLEVCIVCGALELGETEGFHRFPVCRECELGGCWHYDYEDFCTQCDLASYGACPKDCPYDHTCCTCPENETGGRDKVAETCAVHPDDDGDDDEDEDEDEEDEDDEDDEDEEDD